MTEKRASGTEGLAQRLREAREQAGLTQGQAAKQLDWHRPTLSEVEAGRRSVKATELAMLADLYGVSVDWLLGRKRDTEMSVLAAARDVARMRPAELAKLKEFIKSLKRQEPT